jgi:23S rRNA (cytosine1962-C5)-methyltransferase
VVPCVIFEDEHLLVVNKPAGMNTHAPSPFAGEGIYDWPRHREPRWASLAIIHRLDKETSGVIVFAKTPLANRSLTKQFTERAVRKKYVLLTDRPMKRQELVTKSKIARAGERYVSGARGEEAETSFRLVKGTEPPPHDPKNIQHPMKFPHEPWAPPHPGLLLHFAEEKEKGAHSAVQRGNARVGSYYLLEAEPLTGRTHQIRVHAAENGFPILGDVLYGGAPFRRVCLHAAELGLRHPATGEKMTFEAPVDFEKDAREALRTALIDLAETSAFRMIHGASDGWPGWYVDRLGDYLLSQSERGMAEEQKAWLTKVSGPKRVIHHKVLSRQVRGATAAQASPQLVSGEAAPEQFIVHENEIQFELNFNEGYSVGLFLDQRDNRRRFLTGHVAAGFPLYQKVGDRLPIGSGQASACPTVLNVFAYTCGFSVCAAKGGAKTTSLDLSKKYLEWGRRNFVLNGLDPAGHDFIYGDAFDWLRRLAKKARTFDVIVLDPPTFSQSKERGVFRAEANYGELVAAGLPLLKAGGVLFASTNAADWPPEKFLASIEKSVHAAKRKIVQQHYSPQPPDFPISRAEPAYLKTVWMRIA